jgi:hypothetical protein
MEPELSEIELDAIATVQEEVAELLMDYAAGDMGEDQTATTASEIVELLVAALEELHSEQ